ncbi:MAG: response regulator [Desulfobacterales bacterium]|nr:response regulator [Desulfobacterales bacterium]
MSNVLEVDLNQTNVPYEQRENRQKKFKDGTLKILVVDDNEEIRETHKDYLAQHGTIDTAEDGDVALGLIKKAYNSGKQYDVILLDIEMEKMNGDEVLKQIRGPNAFEKKKNIDRLKGSMFIMVTSREGITDVSNAMKYPNVHYIVKGVKNTKDEIIKTIQNAL